MSPFDVLVLGGEPAGLACADYLSSVGVRVGHVYPVPWGLRGASRDIGLAYPELGEPFERLRDALGEELAVEYHAWGKDGIDQLSARFQNFEGLRRGSRLLLMRDEVEARLAGGDALTRQSLGDEVRLMSGAAASNYAPLEELHSASFETHTLAFAPAELCKRFLEILKSRESYQSFEISVEEWSRLQVAVESGAVTLRWAQGLPPLKAEMLLVAAAFETGGLLGKFRDVLVPLLGQAFRSEPLRETTRSSVVGATASWGFERYRFDPQLRLLGCGIDPSSGVFHREPEVIESKNQAFWRRSEALFSDLHRSGEDVLRWGVLFNTTCDGLPLLGPLPGEPRIHVATGFSTSAWSRGYGAGTVIGRALNDVKPEGGLLQRCSPRRFL